MSISRRRFTLLTGSMVALTICGCSKKEDGGTTTTASTQEAGAECKEDAALGVEPFLAGPLSDFKNPGIYTSHREKDGIYLVSDGKKLIAISAVCTHLANWVSWVPAKNQFHCPCHGSNFDNQGINLNTTQKAKKPLERCGLSLTNDGQVKVDPKDTFTRDSFEEAGAFLPLAG